MSLQFIIGGTGSDKTETIQDMVIRRSIQAPDKNYYMIVPEQYTMQTQAQMAGRHPGGGVMNIDIVSFPRLAYRVFDEVGNPLKTVLEDSGKRMVIRRILTENRQHFDIFGGNKVFDNPKPTTVLSRILDFASAKDSTILDFFAGSGTTLHATMQLNAEDGGHRKCILVTNNENNICEEVTYERNKRVIQGYITPKGEKVPGLTSNTLRYYRTDFISRDRTPRNMRALVAASTDLLCIKNDIYKEAKLAGRNINPKIARYFAEGGRSI